jgi:hypothetical protein
MIVSLNEQATLIGQDNSDQTLEILNDVAPGIHTQAEEVFASIEKALSKETESESEMDSVIAKDDAEVAEELPEEEAAAEDTGGDDSAGDDSGSDDDSDSNLR